MMYFGEVLKGMQQSDKDHRAKRAENARLYQTFVSNNPTQQSIKEKSIQKS